MKYCEKSTMILTFNNKTSDRKDFFLTFSCWLTSLTKLNKEETFYVALVLSRYTPVRKEL